MSTGDPVSARAETRKKWEESHEHLRCALKGYLDACLELEADCARPLLLPEDEIELATSLVAIKREMSAADLDENILRGALSSLKRARNLSSKDVPIRRLPPELLSRVFVTVTCNDEIDSGRKESIPNCERSARNLSSVCHRWRQVAIQTRDIWCHIDIGVTSNMFDSCIPLMVLWLERAGNAPLDIHIHTGKMCQFGVLKEAIDPLTQRVAQFRSFNIMSYSASVLSFFVELWLNGNTSGPLDALVLVYGQTSLARDVARAFPSRRPPPERVLTLLADIRVLKLYNIRLDWGLVGFRGLVELVLYGIPGESGPTVEQLFNLFSANPELRYIHIEFFTIHMVPGYSIYPVKLAKLETLKIGSSTGKSIAPLLDLLEPHSPTFRLKFLGSIFFSQEETTAFEAFCSRSNLATLYLISCAGGAEYIACPAVKIPTLKTLVLDSVMLTAHFFRTLAHPNTIAPTTNSVEEGLPSNDLALQNLHLRHCEVEPSALREFVTARPIKHLEVWRCNLPQREGRHYYEEWSKFPEELPMDLRDWLQDNVPSLHFTTMHE